MYKVIFLLVLLFSGSSFASKDDRIRVTGSSTVYPFMTIIAEEYSDNFDHPTPIIEVSGTGGGLNLFCSRIESGRPHMANASRTIKKTEIEKCRTNKISAIYEIKLGYDGIVTAVNKESELSGLTRKNLFLGLASFVPVGGELVPNPYKYWDEVDKNLPHFLIEVYGPSSTSGTRDVFEEKVMLEACKSFPEYKNLTKDHARYESKCKSIRDDGPFIQVGENDNLIIQKLIVNKTAIGVFGYNFLKESSLVIKPLSVDGYSPNEANIANQNYPLSRPLFVYANMEALCKIKGAKDFLEEVTSKAAIGQDGYLADAGLVPMSNNELGIVQNKLAGNIQFKNCK